ncbi:hypothetical protein NEOLEDRAFT_1178285 [Neolentinus lepideus HHB14362 ss-1]|uniref:Uncharacterized protein n=1 Tax=Neolentinus lepideus HHB14362 ss-1 TaxID=1314782 RepID=A0A165SQ07_9AGAM|nr:hypothetical protein NEOLEDRAFT_1178285 [Neolentinus lepideus HHB14362 ss-1]
MGDTSSNVEHVLHIALCIEFSLIIIVWLFYRVTGSLFSPNLAGAIAVSVLVLVLTPGPLSATTCLQTGVNKAQCIFIEEFITSGLVLAVLMLAAKYQVTPFAPIGIDLTLFTGLLNQPTPHAPLAPPLS